MKFSLASLVSWLATLAMLGAPAVDTRLLLHNNMVGGRSLVERRQFLNETDLNKVFELHKLTKCTWINIVTFVVQKKV